MTTTEPAVIARVRRLLAQHGDTPALAHVKAAYEAFHAIPNRQRLATLERAVRAAEGRPLLAGFLLSIPIGLIIGGAGITWEWPLWVMATVAGVVGGGVAVVVVKGKGA